MTGIMDWEAGRFSIVTMVGERTVSGLVNGAFGPRLAVLILTFLVWSLGLVWSSGAASAEIAGRARIVDGDTLVIHGQRIRLHGIDAPESKQFCTRRDGARWRCGRRATRALADKIGAGPVRCVGNDRDRYGRLIAVCFRGSENLNAWLVSRGLAVAYRRYSVDYVDEEARARKAGLGVWSGRFVMPWKWRRGARLGGTGTGTQQQGACRIKGNIGRAGKRIYHVPGGRWYARTRIDAAKGERWFCSEKAARAAGWRRSRQ